MESTEQKWRVYAPQNRDASFDVKMNLRNSYTFSPFIGRGEKILDQRLKSDYGDDVYQMDVNGENVSVVAREKGQRTHDPEVFEDHEEGIFFLVSDKNARDAESRLIKAFDV